MLSVREKYWRYSLFVLIAGLGLTIFAELTPFLGGLLGAVTIYVLLRRQMWFLSERRRWRRSLAASLLLGEAIFFFLVPISLIVWMVVDKIQGVALDPQSVITPVRHVAGLIQQKTGYDLWSESNLQSVLTCFATILPIVGTALVWLPLAAYMSLDGNWGQGVGLVMYGTLVVTQVDNLVRMVMQKKMADVHPLITIFGVFIGLSLFGFMGVIFGPLMLAMFVFCVNVFKRRYLDGLPDRELFQPGGRSGG